MFGAYTEILSQSLDQTDQDVNVTFAGDQKTHSIWLLPQTGLLRNLGR